MAKGATATPPPASDPSGDAVALPVTITSRSVRLAVATATPPPRERRVVAAAALSLRAAAADRDTREGQARPSYARRDDLLEDRLRGARALDRDGHGAIARSPSTTPSKLSAGSDSSSVCR